ncbi:hypothetical protein [Mycobacteroides abscessus]|uniref:hypothetical protein n=1 Tax=Mycobacteroides abscessus TaxID=36809 RepID=UPI0011AACF2D|nr:hypothetical protein [Mycobacteroides abscessus]
MTAVAYLLRLCGVLWVGTSSSAIWLLASLAASPSGQPERYVACGVAFDGLVMFAGLNAGMGLYLIFASTDLVRYRHAVDMFLVSQVLCGLSAAALQVWASSYHGRWVGQMLMTTFGATMVALIWCPVRVRIAAELQRGRLEGSPPLGLRVSP